MEITGIVGTAVSAGTENHGTTVEKKSGLGSDLFLQLLVAQMRYQNPLSGEQDTGQMITQLALFSMVEQVVKIEEGLEKQAHAAAQCGALSLLNERVEVIDQEGTVVSGPVTAVSFRGRQPLLTVQGWEYPYSALIRVEGGLGEDG
ncbi:MAG: hypothetical protein GX878_01810 [Firmicutes bacterium]|nr:hypothetical protein [Bacillota bacterium]